MDYDAYVRTLCDVDLNDVMTSLNRDAHPDRYRVAREEYLRRQGGTLTVSDVDDHFEMAKLERPFREMAALGKWRAVVGVGALVLFLMVEALAWIFDCFSGPR